MKKQMDLIIADDPVSDVKIALAKEHYDRQQVFQKLHDAGHVHIVEDNDPAHIRCQIEDEIFSDERGRFPSTETMARLQLAIAAGRSCRRGVKIENYHADDAMSYGIVGRRVDKSKFDEFMGYTGCWITEDAPTVAGRVTAAVKKFAKGLRP